MLNHYGTALSRIFAIGVDKVNGLLGGDDLENPPNLALYNIADPAQEPVLLDQDFFPTANVNGNTTGLSTGSGGAILSFQNNNVSGNATDGAPSGVVAQQ